MPKKVDELSDAEVRRLRHKVSNGTPVKALHAVGGVAGLLLQCSPPVDGAAIGGRSWILRTTIGGKRSDVGLGGYPDISLTKAREKAREIKAGILQGVDPVINRRAKRSELLREQAKSVTFEQLADEYVLKKSRELKTAKQVQKLSNHLKTYAFPVLGKMVVADIEHAHVVKVLEPIWETKNETASRVRLSIERILDLARVKGLRTGDNPAGWKGKLDHAFPAREKVAKVQHYNALPVDELPEFMGKLHPQDSPATKALEFAILTAARSGEVRGAKWDEIDFNAKLWAIPAERMKKGKAHTVPLSDEALKLLEAMPRLDEHIFIGTRGRPLQDGLVSKAPKKIGYDVTAHGFRSTFKDWARKYTAYADELSELALAHVNSDSTRAAYARDGLIEKRRLLMADWAKFCYRGFALREKNKISMIGGA